MNIEKLKKILLKGEGIDVEFKESRAKLNKDVYETVCAFLNRNGGYILLGVKDDGTVSGVDPNEIENITQSLFTTVNNPQKMNPPSYLDAEVFDIEDEKIISVFVPPSSSVHSVSGKIFDRNGDADLNITGRNAQIANLYLRKQSNYSENKIFPFASLDDLRLDLMEKVRILAKNENGGAHPWMEFDDISLLKSASLYKKDVETGKEGITLAGILLFGKDETILSALPHHRTDAILRRDNLDRYDDRDDIRTNLIESYERLMAFVGKHLKDPFYMEEDVRISIRNKLFREAVANSLIHREYSSAYIAKMIIEKSRVVFENANKPYHYGNITPDNFTPYPKNPSIAKVFREIGWAEELGSGVKKLFRYSKLYGESDPVIIEEDIFKIIIPVEHAMQTDGEVPSEVIPWIESIINDKELSREDLFRILIDKVGSKAVKVGSKIEKQGSKLRINQIKILLLIDDNQKITKNEMAKRIGIGTTAVDNNIAKMKQLNIIERVGPDKGGTWKIILE